MAWLGVEAPLLRGGDGGCLDQQLPIDSRPAATHVPFPGRQYVFTVRNGTCAKCTQTFESVSPIFYFGGLSPNTTVGRAGTVAGEGRG